MPGYIGAFGAFVKVYEGTNRFSETSFISWTENVELFFSICLILQKK